MGKAEKEMMQFEVSEFNTLPGYGHFKISEAGTY